MFIFRFLFLIHFVMGQRYEKNFRFSVFQNSFYPSYYNYNIYNSSCTIAQYTAISDRQISFQLNSNSTNILKGDMEYESDYRFMTCFQIHPSLA